MKDWNVVVSVNQEGFKRAMLALKELGPVERSPYHNVLVMAVDDPLVLLEAIERRTEAVPALYDAISRVAPAAYCFEFQSAEEFEEKAKAILLEWLPRLAGCSFHVRLRRRGQRQLLRSPDVERRLDEFLLEALEKAGTPGSISFGDPDAVIAIDTIDDRAGIAVWTRDELKRHSMLRPD